LRFKKALLSEDNSLHPESYHSNDSIAPCKKALKPRNYEGFEAFLLPPENIELAVTTDKKTSGHLKCYPLVLFAFPYCHGVTL